MSRKRSRTTRKTPKKLSVKKYSNTRKTVKNRTPTPYPITNEKYDKSIIFFDNDERIISGFLEKCTKIHTIKVYESEFTTPLILIKENMLPPEIYSNPAYLYYKSNAELAELPYDIYGGLQTKDLIILKKWLIDSEINSDSYKNRVAIFDFDRTISIIDGFDPLAELKGQFTTNEHMEFLCGGQKRLYWLQDFFQILTSNNIDIKICTNNPGCSANTMIKFMSVIGLTLTDSDIICAIVENNIDENLVQTDIHHSSKYKITALIKRDFC
jgi:hypothetical protein